MPVDRLFQLVAEHSSLAAAEISVRSPRQILDLLSRRNRRYFGPLPWQSVSVLTHEIRVRDAERGQSLTLDLLHRLGLVVPM